MNLNSNLFENLKEAFSLTEVVSFKEFVTSPDFCDDQYMYEFWINEGMNIPELCSELLLDGFSRRWEELLWFLLFSIQGI